MILWLSSFNKFKYNNILKNLKIIVQKKEISVRENYSKKLENQITVKFNDEQKKYEIQLKSKTLKTALGNPYVFNVSKKKLAYLVASEWRNFFIYKKKMETMELCSLVSRSIQIENFKSNEEYYEYVKHNMIKFLDSDTCLTFVSKSEYNGELRKKQFELYQDIIDEFENYFYIYSKKFMGDVLKNKLEFKFNILDFDKDGIFGGDNNEKVKKVIMHWLSNLSPYEFSAFESTVLETKSFLCGAILLRSNCLNLERSKNFFQLNKKSLSDYFYMSLKDIILLSNIETTFQVEKWGKIEGHHDVDEAFLIKRLSSCSLVCS